MLSRLRDEEELRTLRRALFDSFPLAGTPHELAQYQRLLSGEIVTTEQELPSDDSPERKRHLHLVRVYGDALAHTQLSPYAIRQLARNIGKPPHLTGQGKAFAFALECLTATSEQGVPAVLADLTNVLKNADLIVCADPDLPVMIECKLSKVKDARFERQGQRGRQRSRLESIGSFLQKGRGRIFGEENERMTVEVTSRPDFDYRHVRRSVAAAMDHTPTTIVVSDHEVLVAALLGETADTSIVRDWARRARGRVAVGGSLDRLAEPWPRVIPPILWDLPREARWGLMEGDVSVTHFVSVNAFVGLEADDVRVVGVVDVPGSLPWGYEVLVGDERLTLGPNGLLTDVIYNHESITSAGARLLELAANALAVIKSA